jgi:hypothetical protein
MDDFEDVSDQYISKLEEEAVKNPISSVPKIKDGERYSTSQLYAATAELLAGNNWKSAGLATGSIGQYKDESITREVFTTKNNFGKQVITPPASDSPSYFTDPGGFGADGYSISQALKDGLKASGGDRPCTISTKVSQEQPMFRIPFTQIRFGPKRNHWTHLQVKVDESGKATAIHTDSKGIDGMLYSLDTIKKEVEKVFPEVDFESRYMGSQGVRDNTNCGRFAAAYEHAACTQQNGVDTFKLKKADPLEYAKII